MPTGCDDVHFQSTIGSSRPTAKPPPLTQRDICAQALDLDQGGESGLDIHSGMKPKDFIVLGRPTLAKITDHPSIEFADYERRLESMQSIMQSIQQAYLGT